VKHDKSNYGDHPSRLSDDEIFVIFDIVNERGEMEEARDRISRKLRLRRPHRITVARVFNVGVELFKREPNALALTTQEVEEIVERAGYGVSPSRVVKLHRLYQLWKIRRREEREKLDIDAILSKMEERRLKVWFLRLQHWSDEKIAEKLNISLEDIQHDMEETKKELANKTKEETKMGQNQSMLNLPPWVNQAQWEHLEGREQRDERGGIDIITYPTGLGIRQRLQFLRGCFSEINPRSVSFWHPQDEEEIVMIQLCGHLPDKAFWDKVKDFIAKDEKYKILWNRAYERYTSAGEELAPLEPPGSPPTLNPHITSSWARRVLVRALSPELGLSEHFEYYHHKEKDGDFTLHDEELIYRGPDDVAAERKHRDLVDDFVNNHREEFNQTVSLMKNLRELRQQIFARIDQCLRKREYSFNYCPDCPADQARKMLAEES